MGMLDTAFANCDWKWTAFAGASVVASPLIWNIIGRNERKNQTLTRVLGSQKAGCYALATWIFFSSLVRDKLIHIAIEKSKPSSIPCLDSFAPSSLRQWGTGMMGAGLALVGLSYYRLGITGTYLGDYFGILMDAKVTAFPYNIFRDPMYTGATLGFLGLAVHENSPVGLLLTAWVWLVYEVSTGLFENPYTEKIYAEKTAREAAAAKAN